MICFEGGSEWQRQTLYLFQYGHNYVELLRDYKAYCSILKISKLVNYHCRNLYYWSSNSPISLFACQTFSFSRKLKPHIKKAWEYEVYSRIQYYRNFLCIVSKAQKIPVISYPGKDFVFSRLFNILIQFPRESIHNTIILLHNFQ
jgi:hypothetical protein